MRGRKAWLPTSEAWGQPWKVEGIVQQGPLLPAPLSTWGSWQELHSGSGGGIASVLPVEVAKYRNFP